MICLSLLGVTLVLVAICNQLEKAVTVNNEIVDVQYKIANELAQMNLILDNKKDVGDYDPIWKDIPGMEKA